MWRDKVADTFSLLCKNLQRWKGKQKANRWTSDQSKWCWHVNDMLPLPQNYPRASGCKTCTLRTCSQTPLELPAVPDQSALRNFVLSLCKHGDSWQSSSLSCPTTLSSIGKNDLGIIWAQHENVMLNCHSSIRVFFFCEDTITWWFRSGKLHSVLALRKCM